MKDGVYLLGLKLAGRACLVVGSGSEAWARASALVAHGARARVLSEQPPPELARAASMGELVLEVRPFEETDLDSVWLAVLTDRNPDLAERMAHAAEQKRVFFCALDQPAHSSFSHVAIARSGALAVAISTSGRAPALARRLREEFNRLFGETNLSEFVDRLAALRERTSSSDRKRVLDGVVADVKIDGKLDLPDVPDPD